MNNNNIFAERRTLRDRRRQAALAGTIHCRRQRASARRNSPQPAQTDHWWIKVNYLSKEIPIKRP